MIASTSWFAAAEVDRQPAVVSFRSQMVTPEFFALNATSRAIGNLFVGRAIADHMDRKSAAQVAEHAKSFHRLASGPKPDLLQAVSRQIRPTNSHGMFQEAHGAVPPGGIIAPASEACLQANSD